MTSAESHPDPNRLQAYADGQLSPDEQLVVEDHLSACPTCSKAIEGSMLATSRFVALLHALGDEGAPAADLPRLPAPTSPTLPTRGYHVPTTTPHFPGYEILGELGRGGMGIVYKALQVSLNRVVALKAQLAGPEASVTDLLRFRTEAETVARLSHPNILQIHDVGSLEGQVWLALEYVEGGALAERLDGTPRPVDQAVALVEKLASAIQHAHENGVVHRDLKPGNILLDRRPDRDEADVLGEPKIGDFGLALWTERAQRLTLTGTVTGTPSYMAPEQAIGRGERAIGPATDIYALGAILYELLTGRPPFRASTPIITLELVRLSDPLAPSRLQPGVPRDLDTICLKCLEKNPEQRYPTAAALAADLRRFREGRPIQARPVGLLGRAWKWCRRRPAVAALTGSLLFLLVLLMLGTGLAAVWINQARWTAEQNAAAERRARQDAEAVAEESRQRLIRLHVSHGNETISRAGLLGRTLWHTYAWMEDRTDPRREASHRQRLAAVLAELPPLAGVCFHERPVQQALLQAGHARLLTRTDDGRVRLWNPFRAELVATLPHEGQVLHLSISPDGTLAATCGANRQVCLWDARSGQLLRTWPHPAVVAWGTFHPEKSLLATAAADGHVRFWNLQDGTAVGPDLVHNQALQCLVYSPDGTRLLLVDHTNKARLYDTATGAAVGNVLSHAFTFAGVEQQNSFPPVFSRDSKRFLLGTGMRAVVYDSATGNQVLERKERFSIVNGAWNADNSEVLIVESANFATVLGLPPSKTGVTLMHPRQIQRGQFSPDGNLIATASTGGVLNLWDAKFRKPDVLQLRHADTLNVVDFSPDSRYLVTAGGDGVARVWQMDALLPRAGEPAQLVGNRPDRLGLIPDDTDKEKQLHAPNGTRRIRVQGDEAWLQPHPDGTRAGLNLKHAGPIILAVVSDDGQRLATATAERLYVWDLETGEPVGEPLVLTVKPTRLLLNRNGRCLAYLDAERRATVRDVASGRILLGPVSEPGGVPDARDIIRPGLPPIAFSPNGRYLAFGSQRPPFLAEIHDVDRGAKLATPHFRGGLASLEFSPDSTRLAIASADVTTRIFDTATGQATVPHMWHPLFVRAASYSPDGQRLVTVTADGKIRVWDAETGDLLVPAVATDTLRPTRVWFSDDGLRIVSATSTHTLRQYALPQFHLPRALVPDLIRLLTAHEIDASGGMIALDADVFQKEIDRYRQAWLAWRGI